MPVGALVTVPLPVPDLVTLSVYVLREKIAYAEAAGGVVLERIEFEGVQPARLLDLADARIRPITFLPREALEGLAARLTARGRTAEEARGEVDRLKGRAKNLVPLLLPALRQGRNPDVLIAIQRIGPQAAEAIPTLARKVREEEDLLDAYEYGRTLAKIGAPAIPALEALLREAGGKHARAAGGSALARCGPAGAAALRAARR